MLSSVQRICVGLALAAFASGQTSPMAEFTAGYQALAKKDYDSAIAHFRTGLATAPASTAIHKDLAYTLLKIGDNKGARDEFEAALKLNKKDEQAALEYAFLAYETGEPVEARLIFDRLRKAGSPATRTIAELAFQNIDKHLVPENQSSKIHPAEPDGVNPDNGPATTSAPVRSANLWAFFDSAYRSRADVDYLAQRWSEAGISVLYVASWHNMEPDASADAYLKKLIDACHQHAIVVYAWLELPHVSEKFWADHPNWRDKTALGQDAQVGWRKLMNLQNPECSRATAVLVQNLLDRFDWDGVNLAELSFEGQAGLVNPSGFTPMNDNVRSEFKEIADFDPLLLFDTASPRANQKDLGTFLQFRSVLQSRLQSEWLKNVQAIQKTKPNLDLVLTQGDGHSDLVIETPAKKQIGVDLSVIDFSRSKLLDAVAAAAKLSLRVALYSENAISPVDLPAIAAAAAGAQIQQKAPDRMELNAEEQTLIERSGPAAVDGQAWPLRTHAYLILPAGHHTISPGTAQPPFTITGFNADIQSATVSKTEVDIAYQSRARAPVTFDEDVAAIEVDGAPFWKAAANPCSGSAMLPAGQHLVTFSRR